MKEKLEAIKSHNESSYQDPFFGLASKGKDDRGVVTVGIDPRVENPWSTIWRRPRATIRGIVDTNPTHQVLAITALAGFGRALIRAAHFDLGDRMPLLGVIGLCAVAGPTLMILVYLYLGGYGLRMTGGWLGGRASAVEVRAALAWSLVPIVFLLLLWFPALLLFGNELFSEARPRIMASPAARLFLITTYLADFGLLIRGFVIGVKCVAEVHRFSSWRALGAILLLTAIISAIVLGAVFLIGLIGVILR